MKRGVSAYVGVGECKAHKAQAEISVFSEMEADKKQLHPLYNDFAANVLLYIVQIYSNDKYRDCI